MLIPLGIVASSITSDLGSFDLISTSTLVSDTSAITFANITQEYSHLQVRYFTRLNSGGTSSQRVMRIRFNNDGASAYNSHQLSGNGTSVTATNTVVSGYVAIPDAVPWLIDGTFGSGILDIVDYSNAAKNTTVKATLGRIYTNVSYNASICSGFWDNTSAVSQIQILSTGKNFQSGSRFALYGIRG